MHSQLRRSLLALAVALPFASTSSAQTYPTKPITIVVTQGTGSGSDTMARLIGGYLGPALGGNVVVENRAGASGIIGHQYVAGAAPDGYTLLFSSTAGLFVVPVINPNAKYGLADYVPVAPVRRAPFAVLVANTPTAPKTLAELISTLRSKPQSHASAGVGTMTHLGSELLLRTLYNYFRSGTSHRLRIALQIKGLDYEYVAVNLRSEEHLQPAFKALNPQGLLPALVDDDQVMIQSPAILEWLEEKHPTPAPCFGLRRTGCQGLVPQVESARRFQVDLAPYPRILEVEQACLSLSAFATTGPSLQPDAV